MSTVKLNFENTKTGIKTLLDAGSWQDTAPEVVIEAVQEIDELLTLNRFINITQDGFSASEDDQPLGAGLFDAVDITYAVEVAQYSTDRSEAVRLRDRMVEDAVAILTADRTLSGTVAFFQLVSGDEITIRTDRDTFFSAFSILIIARRNIQAA